MAQKGVRSRKASAAADEAAARRLRSVRMITPLRRLVKQIHRAGTERDRAGNRQCMAWALWQDAEHRGVTLHLQFHACKGVPGNAVLSPAACSEPAALKSMLEAGRLYVVTAATPASNSSETFSTRSRL